MLCTKIYTNSSHASLMQAQQPMATLTSPPMVQLPSTDWGYATPYAIR